MSEPTLNVGRDKTPTPISQVPEKDLRWYAEKCKRNDYKSLAASELQRRGMAPPKQQELAPSKGAPAPARQERAITTDLVGAFIDPRKATAALQQAAEHYHLITPATACGSIPEGCEMQMSMVHVSPDDPHLYAVSGGKMGLDKVHLLSILGAAGGSMEYTRRLDDGSHPHYCRCEVGIVYRLFDGTPVRRSGKAEMDVREPNGPRYVEIVQKAREASPPRDPAKQLLELRKFLEPQTESRALNRAIGNMGVRRSYTREELQKPFMVARLMFTGRSEDPEARRQFRAAIAQSFLNGQAALFGSPPPPAPQAAQLHAPPPQGHGFDDSDDDGGYDADAVGEEY